MDHEFSNFSSFHHTYILKETFTFNQYLFVMYSTHPPDQLPTFTLSLRRKKIHTQKGIHFK